MRHKNTIAFLLFLFVILSHNASAEIAISEVIQSDGEISTLFTIFGNDSSKKDEFTLKGMLPRLSPDKKSIAFIENYFTGSMKLSILDVLNKKLEYPPLFMNANLPEGWNIAGLEWSNNSNEIAIVFYGPDFQPKGRPVQVFIFNRSSQKSKLCYESKAQSREAAFFLSVEWFPDDKKILIQDNLVKGSEKISTIDLINNKQIEVYKGISYSATIIQNGDCILFVAPESGIANSKAGRKSIVQSQVLKYDTLREQISNVAELPISQHFLNRYLISKDDSNYLYLPGPDDAGKSLTVLNINNKKIKTISFEKGIFFPQTISQDGQRLLCGIAVKGYEIFDMGTRNFKQVGYFSNNASGEAGLGAFLLFNRIDWVK